MPTPKQHVFKTLLFSQCNFNLWRTFSSARVSLVFLASLSLLLACRATQAFELWLQQSGGVSPSRFFRNTSAPRLRKSLRRPHSSDHQQQATSEQLLFLTTVQKATNSFFSFWEAVTHVTHSKRFSRAAMCRGESPWMLTACRSKRAFRSSSAISTLPENAAQWRQMFSS